LAYSGHLQESLARFEQAGAIYAHHGVRHAQAYGLHMAAWIYLNLGQYELARQQYQAAQTIWLEQNHRHGLALSALGLGETALVFEDFEQARSLLADSVARFLEVQQQDEQAIALALLAVALCGLGRHREARGCVLQAIQIALATGAFAPMLFALDAFALILADTGEIERSLEQYTLVGLHPYLQHSQWRKERYERCILPRAAKLPPETMTAAIARGQQGDIHAAALDVLAELTLMTQAQNAPSLTQSPATSGIGACQRAIRITAHTPLSGPGSRFNTAPTTASMARWRASP
jgi:tetratricopeptide (TPR) repeat protein